MVDHLSLTQVAQQSVTKFIVMILTTLAKHKVVLKLELLCNSMQ
jgi:hypothetical protein